VSPTVTVPRWPDLARRLTETLAEWVVWKNADAAFGGSGDVDSAAPRASWDAIRFEFRTWSRRNQLGPVVVCTHPPRTMFLIALDRAAGTFWELDVSARKYFRGSTLFRAEDLPPLSEMDDRGFRRLTPGAEGVILLLGNGMRWGGRPDPAGLAKRDVVAKLGRDRQGARAAARAFGLPERDVEAVADAVLAGAWDRGAARRIERDALLRSVREPSILGARIRFRAWTKWRCPVLKAVFYEDRQVGDMAAWLAHVRRTHPVHDDD
jgi:hypothetical protein